MIIWSGFGFLVALIGFGCLVLTQFIANALFQNAAYYQTHGWPKLVAFLIAALLVYFLSRVLERQQGRAMIDKATGREVVLKPRHSLFFVPLKYWPYILVGLGVIALFL
jgi:membrane protein implicated in regulation of membrane protease activity